MTKLPTRVRRFLVRYSSSPSAQSYVRALRSAAKAVKNNVPLSKYLAYRIAMLSESAPQEGPPLPSITSTAGTDIKVTPNPEFAKWPPFVDRGPDPISEQASWLRDQNAIEARALRKDFDDANSEWNHFARRREDHRKRSEDASALLHAKVADGSAAVPATLRRNATERGRPALPFPRRLIGTYISRALLFAAESYLVACPFYDRIGVDFTNLGRELEHNPVGVLAGAAFAVATVGVVTTFMRVLLEGGISLCESLSSHQQRLTKAAALAVLAIPLLIALYGIADMRHASSQATQIPQAGSVATVESNAPWLAFLMLTILLPIGLAWLEHEASVEHAARGRIREAQRAWDQIENSQREVRERIEELLSIESRAEELCRIRGDQARDRIRAVGTVLSEHKTAGVDAIADHLLYARNFASSVTSLIERDKYLFIREARKRGLDHLIDDTPTGPGRSDGRLLTPPPGGNGVDRSGAFAQERADA